MTKSEFIKLADEHGFDNAVADLSYDTQGIVSIDDLKSYIKCAVENDEWYLVEHLADKLLHAKETEFYNYDMGMGAMDYPSPIVSIEDLEDFFDDKE